MTAAAPKTARIPALLAILDGVGIAEACPTNAVTCADAPFLDELFHGDRWPHRTLSAAGRDVGLPEGQMGNSEVGHLNIGSGRIVNQELTRIDCAIEDGSLRQNPALLSAMQISRDHGSTLHFFGLLSDGGVHSMQDHLEALLSMAADFGVQRIRIHAFLDGRDVAPTSGQGYVQRARDYCYQLKASHPGLDARIGSISGRYYAMDRDNRWERIEQAWEAIVMPELSINPALVLPPGSDPAAYVQASYTEGVTDEFVVPAAIGDDGVTDGDCIIFFNFRPDRARELTRAFIDPEFSGFDLPQRPLVTYVCMTEYDPAFAEQYGALVAFPKTFPENVLADYLASLGLRQLHIAETEKYAHVTFFLNGGIEAPKAGEQRLLIPSPKVATYDLQPQMSAPAVTAALVEAINSDAADVYIVNYANGDMVGHTGVLPAAIEAIEEVDKGLQQVVAAILDKGGVGIITADHGNSEQMTTPDGQPWTAHTLSPVPFVVLGAEPGTTLDSETPARLADIAPTLMDLMHLEIPPEWTGHSLLQRI
ncbi:MAG: 2,3-bisphosphoglycerate-independent phosphoglycerate mutase [Coriobacteriales bacterium]|jgi:2,3-bisphosphoglycerate-independent phosphoglycerate mutase|nr:2,3-bisphosphoglycerate-independent phosphoglycerate mutase [Coriobacteriales bacterium]